MATSPLDGPESLTGPSPLCFPLTHRSGHPSVGAGVDIPVLLAEACLGQATLLPVRPSEPHSAGMRPGGAKESSDRSGTEVEACLPAFPEASSTPQSPAFGKA